MPVSPSVLGQGWNIQVMITSVIPKLISRNVLALSSALIVRVEVPPALG